MVEDCNDSNSSNVDVKTRFKENDRRCAMNQNLSLQQARERAVELMQKGYH
jgi:hypothetical protein